MHTWWQTTFPQGRQTLTIEDANGHTVGIAYGSKGQGKPVVLLHGIGVWSYCWRYNIDHLSQAGQVICFDAKGYGFSDKLPHPEQAGHQVIELERILEQLCDRPAVLVAESLGALTALALATRRPDLIDRLVVINVPIFPRQLPSWGMRLIAGLPMDIVHSADRLRIARWFSPLVFQAAAIARMEVVANPSQVNPEDVYGMIYPYIEFPYAVTKFAQDLKLGLQEIEALRRGKTTFLGQIQESLGAIATPTLVLWGDRDRWFPITDGMRLHQQIPKAQFQVIPNCGHHAATGQPDIVNAAVLDFIQADLVIPR